MSRTTKYFTRMMVCLALMAACAVTAHALDKGYYAESSKLASGKWVKIAIKESGIYQITADDIRSGYALASAYDFDVINADLIAGLPEVEDE